MAGCSCETEYESSATHRRLCECSHHSGVIDPELRCNDEYSSPIDLFTCGRLRMHGGAHRDFTYGALWPQGEVPEVRRDLR